MVIMHPGERSVTRRDGRGPPPDASTMRAWRWRDCRRVQLQIMHLHLDGQNYQDNGGSWSMLVAAQCRRHDDIYTCILNYDMIRADRVRVPVSGARIRRFYINSLL